MRVELVQDARARLAESPLWDQASERLLWVDIPVGQVHRFNPADGSDLILDVGQPVGSLCLGIDGGLVLAMRDGFGLVGSASDRVDGLVSVERQRTDNRMNDGRCDPAGRFWAGTMAQEWEHAPRAGALYRLDGRGGSLAATRVLAEVTVSNGIDWSPDGGLMYFIDSPTQRVDVFDYVAESGAITGRRTFVEIPPADGLPDGMVVDADGCVWVALFGAGRLRRYSPSGQIDCEVHLPVTLVTSATFGGPGLEDLYITTAKHRLTPHEREQQTHAGSIFVCHPGPRGKPAHRFLWV
jgi:sugar lactone lactonase YvrE